MSDVSHSALYGSGVFTTIRIIDGEPWLWDKHWRRLMHDAAVVGIDASGINEDHLRQELKAKVISSSLSLGKARLTIGEERSSPLWSDVGNNAPPSVSVLTAPLRKLPSTFRLGVSPFSMNSRSPIAGLKTCNYLDQLVALRTSMGSGLNETVRLNERGHVTSACMANIFWLKDEHLYTPDLSTGCLPGTTRELICETFDVNHVEIGTEELNKADAIFLTSAGLGVVRVDEFDGREMTPLDHAILRLVPA